jgi:hypothetical protein
VQKRRNSFLVRIDEPADEALEHQPGANAELSARYERLNEEFLRRARIAWGGDQK